MKIEFEGAGGAYQSYMGALLSILFILLSASFLYSKALVLLHNTAVTVTTNLKRGDIDQSEKFGHQNSLFVAAALTDFSDGAESIEDPRYGEIVFEHRGWGETGNEYNIYQRTIESKHACSDQELGLVEGDETTITFPLVEESRPMVENWRKKFSCIKKEDF